MNGVHDLGGTDGLGPVVVPDREPVFTAEWEKAAFAMFSMCFRAGFFGVDEFRYGIEQMHPAVYLLSPYYEHWIHTVEHYGKAKGLLDLEEVSTRSGRMPRTIARLRSSRPWRWRRASPARYSLGALAQMVV